MADSRSTYRLAYPNVEGSVVTEKILIQDWPWI